MSMQNDMLSVGILNATGGYYIGAGANNKTHSTPYLQELDWVAFTPTSTTGTISASTNCQYKVSGNICTVNMVFTYTSGATAIGSFAGLPFDNKSQPGNTIARCYDTGDELNYVFVVLTAVGAKTFTMQGVAALFENTHTYNIRAQLKYKIVSDGEPIQFNRANTLYGNFITTRNLYFSTLPTNNALSNILNIQSNTDADSLVAGSNVASIDTNNSVYRITNDTVMLWVDVIFTTGAGFNTTFTFTGLPVSSVFTAAVACDFTRSDNSQFIGGSMSVSGTTISLLTYDTATAGVAYHVNGFLEYQRS